MPIKDKTACSQTVLTTHEQKRWNSRYGTQPYSLSQALKLFHQNVTYCHHYLGQGTSYASCDCLSEAPSPDADLQGLRRCSARH